VLLQGRQRESTVVFWSRMTSVHLAINSLFRHTADPASEKTTCRGLLSSGMLNRVEWKVLTFRSNMPSSFSGQKEETTRSSESLGLIYEFTLPHITGQRISIATAMIISSFKMATHTEVSLSVTFAAGRQWQVLYDRWYEERDVKHTDTLQPPGALLQ
jgi:hypothetical protein